ncbi:MAG TPA: hypothetical protein VFU07_05385 [Candidatus Lumbricidophila sp.]|nr:hypothetical protein [Candidatus Lumbricidophila sp.]
MTPKRTNPYAREYANFLKQTQGHQLTVLHDDGLYRHLRMHTPADGSIWSWNMVTWPGYLATVGDIANGYTFTRELDMIGFFEMGMHFQDYYSDGAPSIDFRYWAEKLANTQRDSVREFSKEKFLERVRYTLSDDGYITSEVDDLLSSAAWCDSTHAAHEWLEEHSSKVGQDTWEWDLSEFSVHFLYTCWAINKTVSAYRATQAKAVPA